MNKHLSKLIGHYRQTRNLNFGELAKLCNLNPKKWANKICNFEREGYFDADDMVHKLIKVLEIDPQEVREAVQKDYEVWESWVNELVKMELVVKLIPGIYKSVKIPEEINTEDLALEFASSVAKEWKREVCLALNRKESVWFRESGTLWFRSTAQPGIPNVPYTSIGGKGFHFG